MLKKRYRLTKRGSFSYVYRAGTKKNSAAFSIIFVKSKTLKIGFSVSNKVGNAVVRNKLRRRLRAIFKEVIGDIKPAQLVVSAFVKSAQLSYAEIKKEVLALLRSSNLFLTTVTAD